MNLRQLSARNSAWRLIRRRRLADLIPAAGPARGAASVAVALAEPEPVATQPEPPEVRVRHHTYMSEAYDAEPGQTTTAIGYQDAGLLRDRSIDGETTVIGTYGVQQTIERDVEDPPLYRALVAELHRLGVGVEPETSQACGDCGLKTWDADDLEPGDDVCVCDKPFDEDGLCDFCSDYSCPTCQPLDDEDHDGDAVLLPRLDLDGGEDRG